MPAHKLYHTPEEKAEAKRRDRAKYQASERGRQKRKEWEAENQERVQQRYARYRQTEKYRAAQARYRGSDHGKSKVTEYSEWARKSDPIRIKARSAVTIELRKGNILRPSGCDVCGRPGTPDAHHFLGYAPEHWLDVLWLCRICHKAAHS